MPAIKLKVWESIARKGSKGEKAGPSSGSRKRRRIASDNEDEYESESASESEESKNQSPKAASQRTTRRKRSTSRSQSQAPDPDKLFDDDANVDIVNTSPTNDDIPDRAPTPTSGVPAPALSRKRSTKKKSTAIAVTSDEDDEYVDSGKRQDDNDDDFVVDSPPRRGGKRGGAGAGAGRGRGKAKEKGGGIGEIHIKDERKLPPPPVAAAGPSGDAKTGTKRRRETVSELNAEGSSKVEASNASTTAGAGQPSSSTTSAPTKPSQESTTSSKPTATLPASNVRKLPPIKKNKNLAGATSGTAPSSGPSTPSDRRASSSISVDIVNGSALAAAAVASMTSSSRALHASLPRKPVQKKTQDIDLSSPDIYNSLFKTGSSAPRVGVNSRLKEEERRKELTKMRDEARAARMANLQKNTFDLLAAHEKITRFEAKMRARNSPALYPNHLGCGLKVVSARRHANEDGLGQARRSGFLG